MSDQVVFRKTWKREVAVALLAWLVGMVTWIVVTDLAAGVELIKTLIVPVIGLAAAMFGVQSWQNVSAAQHQTGIAAPPAPPIPSNTEANKNAAPFRPNAKEDH